MSDRVQRLDTAYVAGLLTLTALGALIALRSGFGGITVRLGD